jgi:TRAP-type uncharacterized transport system fused permease subunit
MQTFLFVLILLAALGALVSVVRGVIVMVRTSHEDMTGTGVSQSGLRQNRIMWRRIQFQAIAVVFCIILLMLSRGHAG